MAASTRRLNLKIYPRSDLGFEREVRDAIARLAKAMADEDALRQAILTDLHQVYRAASITVQQPLASLEPGERTWYVFRDGRLRRDDEHLDRLYDALTEARRLHRETAIALERAVTTAAAAGFGDRRREDGAAYEGAERRRVSPAPGPRTPRAGHPRRRAPRTEPRTDGDSAPQP